MEDEGARGVPHTSAALEHPRSISVVDVIEHQ
jgi:hypothetical protein